MVINYSAVLVSAVVAMIVGYFWYGPLFGKKWLKVIGADQADLAARKEMQKKAGPLYLLQFLLTLFQVYVFAHYVAGWNEVSGVENALWIWVAFVVPVLAGTAMWNNDSREVAWTRFLLQAGYQFVIFLLFGLVLGAWR